MGPDRCDAVVFEDVVDVVVEPLGTAFERDEGVADGVLFLFFFERPTLFDPVEVFARVFAIHGILRSAHLVLLGRVQVERRRMAGSADNRGNRLGCLPPLQP